MLSCPAAEVPLPCGQSDDQGADSNHDALKYGSMDLSPS